MCLGKNGVDQEDRRLQEEQIMLENQCKALQELQERIKVLETTLAQNQQAYAEESNRLEVLKKVCDTLDEVPLVMLTAGAIQDTLMLEKLDELEELLRSVFDGPRFETTDEIAKEQSP